MYSSIKKKRCKCGCGKMPSLSYDGWNYACAPDEIKEKVGNKRKQAQRRSYEKVKTRSLHSLPDNRSMVDKNKGDEVGEKLEQWFFDRRNDMTGFCWCGCGKLSSKNDDKYFKFSACHLLAKSKFKSIMYHPLNFVELNFWEGHHTTFDNMGYEYCKNTNPILWKIVVERFKILYPLIAPEERKFIPQALLETLK